MIPRTTTSEVRRVLRGANIGRVTSTSSVAGQDAGVVGTSSGGGSASTVGKGRGNTGDATPARAVDDGRAGDRPNDVLAIVIRRCRPSWGGRILGRWPSPPDAPASVAPPSQPNRLRRAPAHATAPTTDPDGGAGDIHELLTAAVAEAAGLLKADGAMVYLLDPESGILRFAHDAGIKSRARPRADPCHPAAGGRGAVRPGGRRSLGGGHRRLPGRRRLPPRRAIPTTSSARSGSARWSLRRWSPVTRSSERSARSPTNPTPSILPRSAWSAPWPTTRPRRCATPA